MTTMQATMRICAGGTLLLFSSVTTAAVLNVPAQYPTIQAAVDAAVDGDTVLVADGTYTGVGNRDIDLTDRAITVRSQNGPQSCIIDCQYSAQGFAVGFGDDGAGATLIEGFTITHGAADVWNYQAFL